MQAIVRYSPWSMLRGIQEEVNQLFDKSVTEKGTAQWTPHVDITEEQDKHRVIVDLPGVNPKDIKLNVENNILSIQGERKAEFKKEKEGYSRIERSSGSFYRQFTLPENVEEKAIQAKSKHGVLEIILPKKEPSQPKSIEIKVNEGD